jgi:hypothetical protein
MTILDNILSTGNGGLVKQLAGQFGITPDQATSATSALLPAIAAGVQEKLATGGPTALSDLISSGNLSKFATDPASLGTSAALDQGRSLLNQIFGNGDLSSIASAVAEKAGISSSVVTQMLPIAATILGAFLSKSAAGGQDEMTKNLSAIAGAGHSGVLSAVKSLAAKVFG